MPRMSAGSKGTGTMAEDTTEAGTIDLTDDLHDLKVPGLSAAVVKDGEVVLTAVAGLADTRRCRPVTPDTAFTWASVSKTVTAAALLQLYDQRRLGLDDDINDHLPFEVRIPACPGTAITPHHLLTHTSGIKDSKVYSSLYVEGDSPVPLGEFLEDYLAVGGRYYDRKRNFRSRRPGTVHEYSNIGAGVIGYLVEVLSGVPFEQYAADQIFAPLDMERTSFMLAGLERDAIALPNGTGPLQGFPTFPDGTLRSSPSNLAKFLIACMQGGTYGGQKILSRTTAAQMLTPQTRVDSTQGLIWHTEKFGKKTLWGHAGDDPGISSNMFFHPASQIGVLLVANGEWKHDARRTMRKLLRHARSR